MVQAPLSSSNNTHDMFVHLPDASDAERLHDRQFAGTDDTAFRFQQLIKTLKVEVRISGTKEGGDEG